MAADARKSSNSRENSRSWPQNPPYTDREQRGRTAVAQDKALCQKTLFVTLEYATLVLNSASIDRWNAVLLLF